MKRLENGTIGCAAAVLWLAAIGAGVQAAPNGPLFQDDPVTARGFSPDKAFQLGDVDHVNLFNGNLLLTLPIGPRCPVSNHLSYGLTLTYNGNLWDFEHWCDGGPPGDRCSTAAHPGAGFQAGMGWTLSMGRLLPSNLEFINESPQWVYVGADGGRHRFWDTLHPGETPVSGVLQYTRDGSYLRMSAGQTRKVQFPDGTLQIFRDLNGVGEWALTDIEDPFGRRMEIGYCALPSPCHENSADPSWMRWRIVDQHGREHTVEFVAGTASYPWRRVSSVTLAAFDGTQAVYSFGCTQPVLPRACPQNVTEPGPIQLPLLSTLILPDGSTYGFGYYDAPPVGSACRGNSGRVREVTLPTGGKVGWTYQTYVYGLPENPLPGGDQPPKTWRRDPAADGGVGRVLGMDLRLAVDVLLRKPAGRAGGRGDGAERHNESPSLLDQPVPARFGLSRRSGGLDGVRLRPAVSPRRERSDRREPLSFDRKT